MGRTQRVPRLVPYAQELVENAYVQENLRDGAVKLREAYRRAQKRRVEPTRDERLRQHLRSAAQSLTEAGRALRSRRRKPQRRWGPRILVIAGLGVAGAAVAMWARERLTDQDFGSEPSAVNSQPESVPRPSEPAAAY
jgi:ferric-dicitrate binding protein FerR (iron transport regulator)